ncbi:NAD(P)/FAD-dependent oxidoreductase [Mesorhizobium sp. BR115XR7A]|uniref:NAD(P)-binding protein n=1 Tax=Mesorhizobium sp. BR115XR7A TaxID=2876645 RepID=UPI001CCFD095|nr:NAD(P)-binding protein [Mesorhizobium sp. BR115XR7A]MBZ9907742.1 NAD(P)/FAD-dependent oxidoreductase [Mesorhizobium sp. BR115XR7A]MBZ9929055.1 NAD(P)/FAD-dependent oxidoreductase [Mesorhizobium sp. BR1-1-5]
MPFQRTKFRLDTATALPHMLTGMTRGSINTPSDVASTYEVTEKVFVLGSLSKGVTVYQQQARALNLAWALRELNVHKGRALAKVAVIGGGAAGLTFASAISSFPGVQVTLFEQRWDLCPLQQGSDTRWLHPFIYHWPAVGSRRPSASLPVLNWNAGRASDVAAKMLDAFGDRCTENERNSRLVPNVFLGLGYLKVDALRGEVEWLGLAGDRAGRHFRAGEPAGNRQAFDTIIVAAGFGLEAGQLTQEAIASGSYWRNDTLGQPVLTGARPVFVVSGHGDGGLVDLCRLTIERFRQDTILAELFSNDLEEVEKELRALVGPTGGRLPANVKKLLDRASTPLSRYLKTATKTLRSRLRKDVRAVLHVRPEQEEDWSVDQLFENKSSFLNRFLLYLLYDAGAFAITLEPIAEFAKRQGIPQSHIVQRYGTGSYAHVLGLFSDQNKVSARLGKMKDDDDQSPDELWLPGFFSPDPKGLVS